MMCFGNVFVKLILEMYGNQMIEVGNGAGDFYEGESLHDSKCGFGVKQWDRFFLLFHKDQQVLSEKTAKRKRC